MIALHVDVRIRPEGRAEFVEVMRANAAASVADEPGCLLFHVIADEADPAHFMFYEVYDDHAAFEAHKAAPHFAVWAEAKQRLVVAQTNTFGDVVTALGSATLDGLDGLGGTGDSGTSSGDPV